MYASPIQNLINAFSRLPSVGPRTAERFVFSLLKSGKKDVGELTLALRMLMDEVKSCETCWDFSDASPCALCADPRRDTSVICVVAEPHDVQAIERTKQFHGRYHVLRGTLDPMEAEKNERLKMPELLDRLRDERIKEIILALNPDVAGETTMMYLERMLKESAPAIHITRLARGLPMGSDLRYADEITLGSALSHRTRQN